MKMHQEEDDESAMGKESGGRSASSNVGGAGDAVAGDADIVVHSPTPGPPVPESANSRHCLKTRPRIR
jgi:hypothetical protein